MKDKLKVAFTREFLPIDSGFYDGADLIILERKAFLSLNYKRELGGEDETILTISKFSKGLSAPCFIALKTNNYGQIKRSVAVFERGKLLSISDANLPQESETSSFGYKVVKTALGKIGVAVSKDILSPDCLKALTLCESELIVNLYADVYDFSMQALVPSLSYVYGVPIISCGAHGVIGVTGQGRTEFVCEKNRAVFTTSTKRMAKEVPIRTFSNV